MIKEAIGTGATIEEAIENAKRELNAPENADVKTEIIVLPEKKLFIRKPGKARAYYEMPDEDKKAAPAEKAAKPQAEKKAEPVKVEKPVGVPVDKKDYKVAVEYLENIMNGLGINNAQINLEKVEETIFINISCGEDFGVIIGRRGETLDSIQYLINLVANRGKEDYTRFTINVDNYREKREVTLRNLAKKSASQVARSGRNIVLEPMNPYERRIIHTSIQEIENVTSHSIGTDADRRVVIQLADGVKPTGGGRYNNNRRPGGYNNNNRGGYNNNRRPGGYNNNNNGGNYNRSNNNYNRNNNDNASAAPKREPRQDVAGATLYGKIEINKTEE